MSTENRDYFKELRESLNPEDIKNILYKYQVSPVKETDKYIIYPTVCHNLHGGSPKLYYYTDSHMFKCYTQCDGMFDIFTLIIKMEKLRGNNINAYQAIEKCDLQIRDFLSGLNIDDNQEEVNYLYNLLHTKLQISELRALDETILNRYLFDMKALKVWNNENISYNAMLKFKIRFDPVNNCIVIPNYDIDNNLISIRARYFDGDAKYKPILYGSQILSHPSSMSLYGLNITKDAIQKYHKVIIFEGEKSVLKYETLYEKNNISVATLGKTISMQQILLLRNFGVNEVVLAYDADYRNYDEMAIKRREYMKIANTLKPFFSTCVLVDLDMNLLGYKDSPIDKGKEVFEKIYKNRLYV